MIKVEKIEVQIKYRKENGLFVVDIDGLKLPYDMQVLERNIISIPPGVIGGNHKHPRVEMFVTLDDGVEFHWYDELTKSNIVENMSPENDRISAYLVPAMVPHAVINVSDRPITLVEFATGPQENVQRVEVV